MNYGPSMVSDELMDMLIDHEIDMGVDRSFYDPDLMKQFVKKQEAEQARLQELKKKQLQQEMLYFTIDEETGERIPKQTQSDKDLPPPQYPGDSDLSKELAELGEIADFLEENQQDNTTPGGYFDSSTAPVANHAFDTFQSLDNNNCQVEDIWATQITMLPGPSYDSSSPDWQTDSMMGDNRVPDMIMSNIWDNEETPERPTDYFSSYSAEGTSAHAGGMLQALAGGVEPSYMTAGIQAKYQQMPAGSSPYGDYYSANSDSGVDEPFQTQDQQFGFEKTGNCSLSQSLNEDIKPQINFDEAFGNSGSSQNGGGSSSKSSDEFSSYGSEDGEAARFAKMESERSKRNACRDEMRCRELEIPFSVEAITNYPVEEFNTLIRRHSLTEDQLSLIKDIRRRGKNKVAAQNCRKKKMSELSGLEEEIHDLKRKRTELVRDKEDLIRNKHHLKDQLDQTYAEVFNSIRDHLGRPYDPHYYSLHITDEGDAQIIPNKISPFTGLMY